MAKIDTTSDQNRNDSVIPGSEELDQMGDEAGGGQKGEGGGQNRGDVIKLDPVLWSRAVRRSDRVGESRGGREGGVG
jgi:hypothetical protein